MRLLNRVAAAISSIRAPDRSVQRKLFRCDLKDIAARAFGILRPRHTVVSLAFPTRFSHRHSNLPITRHASVN
jgi:hypothetical protein